MSQVFTKIGFEIDHAINKVIKFMSSDAPQHDTEKHMRARISDEEALAIVRNNFKPNKSAQRKVFHEKGYGISTERISKFYNQVLKEDALNKKQL